MNLGLLNRIDIRFLNAIRRTYKAYATHGSRSPEKLKVLHGWIKVGLKGILGNEYTITSMSEEPHNPKEQNVMGRYYRKNVDIYVSRDNAVIGIISVKFINSSFIKNANNYLETQMGETANLQNDDIVFGHLFCLTEPVPKYKQNKTWEKTEEIREKDIEKYYRLVNDQGHAPHKPDVQGICIAKLDIPDVTIIPRPTVHDVTIPRLVNAQDLTRLDARYRTFILTQMDIKTFFTDFVQKVDAKYTEWQQANQQNQP